LRHYARDLDPELRVNYCRLAAVSVDPPDVAGALRVGLGAGFAFLSDHERRAIRELEIVDLTDPKHGLIAIPYTFSLAPDLAIHKVYNGWWYVGRPTVEELRQDLRALLAACRADYVYDGPAPGARQDIASRA
jgi:peroxiredoxin